MPDSSLRVIVGSDFACFTRPEMKVERVSYDVMTPSAARGVLEAIFWKPAIQWRVQSITPLKPVQFIQLRRQEVKSKASMPAKKDWQEGRAIAPINVDKMEKGRPNSPATRTLRSTLALKDAAYLIEADFDLVGYGKDEHPAKYRAQFRRRVARGACYKRPYLGCREFSAWFREPTGQETPAMGTRPLGRMLFDMEFKSIDNDNYDSYNVTPHFFHAELDNGVLHVPQEKYAEIYTT